MFSLRTRGRELIRYNGADISRKIRRRRVLSPFPIHSGTDVSQFRFIMRQKFATTQDFATPDQKLEGTSETRRLGREWWGEEGCGRNGFFKVFFHFINTSESPLHSFHFHHVPREEKTEFQSERVQGWTSEEALGPLEPLGSTTCHHQHDAFLLVVNNDAPLIPLVSRLRRRWTLYLISHCERSTFVKVWRRWIVPQDRPPSPPNRAVAGPTANKQNLYLNFSTIPV